VGFEVKSRFDIFCSFEQTPSVTVLRINTVPPPPKEEATTDGKYEIKGGRMISAPTMQNCVLPGTPDGVPYTTDGGYDINIRRDESSRHV
jgi:hypothetical protein